MCDIKLFLFRTHFIPHFTSFVLGQSRFIDSVTAISPKGYTLNSSGSASLINRNPGQQQPALKTMATGRCRKTLTETQLMTKTKNELVKMLLNASDDDVTLTKELINSIPSQSLDTRVNNDFISALKPLIEEATSGLKEEITMLRSEVAQLKEQLNQGIEEVKGSVASDAAERAPFSETVTAAKYCDAIKRSVQTALQEDKMKSELIVSGVDENEEVQNFITQLCDKIQIVKKPVDAKRLGRKKDDRNRVIKVTFPSPFDARTFEARYFQEKDRDDVSNIRIRPCRSKEEQKIYAERRSKVFQLNKGAREANLNESHSLRPSGDIWKFFKNENGKWVRDRDWALNEEQTVN